MVERRPAVGRARRGAAPRRGGMAARGRLLRDGAEGRLRVEEREDVHAQMDQRNETFVPHLLAITVGTTVDFPNDDRTYHNVFSLSKAKRFDLGRYAAGPIQIGAVRSAWRSARLLRDPLAHERLHPGVHAPLLRRDRCRTAATRSTACRRAPTRWSRGWKARSATRRSITVTPDSRVVETRLPPAMTLLSSLTNRIFLACALLAVATTGVAVYVVGARATREAETELARGLADAATQVAQQQRALAARYVVFARLLADLPKLKSAVETQMPADGRADCRRLSAAGRRRPAADHRTRRRRAGSRRRRRRRSRAGLDRERAAPATRCSSSGRTRAASCRWSRFPISIGLDVPGRARYAQHRRAARRAPRRSASSARRRARWPSRSTTTCARRRCRARRGHRSCRWPTRRRPRASGWPTPNTSGWRCPPLPLGAPACPRPAAGGRRRSSCSRAPSGCGSCAPSKRRSLIAAVAAVLLATVLSYAVARTVTRPLGAITNTMREVAVTGDLTRKITLRGPAIWQDEDARLLATTYNSLTDSIARFQREAAQKEQLLSLGPAVHGDRARGAQPADDHQDGAALAAPDAPRRRRSSEAVERHRRRGRSPEPHRQRRARFRAAAGVLARAGGPRAPLPRCRGCRVGGRRRAGRRSRRCPSDPVLVVTDAGTPPDGPGQPARERASGGAGAREPPATRAAASSAWRRRGAAARAERGHDRVRCRSATGARASGRRTCPQIFEPYFTTRRSGTGLGLPIARNIVEGLGGTLAISTAEGGTTIEIDLPARPPGAAVT